MNLFDINNELQKLKGMVSELLDREFYPIDYTEYIKYPLTDFKQIYKYKNVYYESPRAVYNAAQLTDTMNIRTFRSICENTERHHELWPHGILVVYAAFKEAIGYYLTCDGKILTRKNLSLVRSNPYNSQFEMNLKGVRFAFNKATSVYSTFVDNDWEDKLYHIDGNYGNCGVDNLLPKVQV